MALREYRPKVTIAIPAPTKPRPARSGRVGLLPLSARRPADGCAESIVLSVAGTAATAAGAVTNV